MERLQYDVVNAVGKKVKGLDLLSNIFDVKASPDVVHSVVRWQLAKRRAGTHSALTRGQMIGGNKKLYRQKGTGRARAGGASSPTRVGGGVAHGPSPRDYAFKITKRKRKQALCMVLTQKRQNKELVIVDSFALKDGKTREMAKVLGGLGIGQESALILLKKGHEESDKVALAARNLPRVKVLEINGVNVFDLLKFKYVVSNEETIKALENKLEGVS